jgi:hypothetical protein
MTATKRRNFTRRKTRPWRREELWTEEEITVVLAACPPNTQYYSSEDPWVRELADLLNRSPAAISFHLGNIFTLKRPGHGLENVGKETARIFEKYRGRDAELQKVAGRLRREHFGGLVSPRLESNVTEDEADRLEEELRRRFPEARLPTGAVILYRYKGSVWLGVLATIQLALLYPEQTRTLLQLAIEILGKAVRRTPAVQVVLDGRTVDLAEMEIHSRAPKFHAHDLTEEDRVRLAILLRRLKSLRRWKPTTARLDFYASADGTAERDRIRSYFGIDASRLCRKCLMMLTDALDDAIATGKI